MCGSVTFQNNVVFSVLLFHFPSFFFFICLFISFICSSPRSIFKTVSKLYQQLKYSSQNIILMGTTFSALFSLYTVMLLLAPEGRPGMSDVSPLSGISGLSFDSTLLSPLFFFCLVLLPFLSYLFLPAGPFF